MFKIKGWWNNITFRKFLEIVLKKLSESYRFITFSRSFCLIIVTLKR